MACCGEPSGGLTSATPSILGRHPPLWRTGGPPPLRNSKEARPIRRDLLNTHVHESVPDILHDLGCRTLSSSTCVKMSVAPLSAMRMQHLKVHAHSSHNVFWPNLAERDAPPAQATTTRRWLSRPAAGHYFDDHSIARIACCMDWAIVSRIHWEAGSNACMRCCIC